MFRSPARWAEKQTDNNMSKGLKLERIGMFLEYNEMFFDRESTSTDTLKVWPKECLIGFTKIKSKTFQC